MTSRNTVRLEAPVFCKTLKTEIPLKKCLDSYVEANAFSDRESNCFKCVQGQQVRNHIARS